MTDIERRNLAAGVSFVLVFAILLLFHASLGAVLVLGGVAALSLVATR